jgi:alpha-galactosidase
MLGQENIEIAGKLIIDTVDGSLNLIHRGTSIVKLARGEVNYRIGQTEKRFRLSGDIAYGLVQDKVSLSARDEMVELTWWASAAAEGVEIGSKVTNVGSQPIEILQLHPLVVSSQDGGQLDLGASPEAWSFYQNGWQSWSPTFARHLADGLFTLPEDREYLFKHHPYLVPSTSKTLVSHWFTILCDRDSRMSLLVGFITAKDQLAEVRLEADTDGFQQLAAICHADGLTLPPGASLSSERLLLAINDDPLALLELYGTSLGQAMDARQVREIPVGWCSWYYFYGENRADDVVANLDAAREQGLPLEVMLIDDGYQREIGDWLEVDETKFPQGMEWLAQKIKRAGFRPGLWIAPFAVSSLSRLYTEHPDWVLRSEAGEPILAWHHWAVPTYALDVSHPEVQEWLRELFFVLGEEWGYEFFKLDFLYAAALEGRRYDPSMSRAQALRVGLEIIRETVGEKFILGCGCPLGPAVGLVDGMRIGPDVATYWRYFQRDLSAAATENALRNTVARFFMHRRLWTSDPDCVLVRSRAEESDLTLNEMRSLVTIVGLCGGMVMSGDDLASIHPSRLNYLRAILPPHGGAAIPLDLFDNELPRLLSLPVHTDHGRWLIAAFINWEDRTVRTVIEFAHLGLQGDQDYHVYDYWHRRYLGIGRERLVIPRHQPHETVVLLFKPVSQRPELLTSTFHLTQGGVEVRSVSWEEPGGDRKRMIVELNKQGSQFGQLLFTVPQPYVVTGARLNGRRRGVNHIARGVVSLGLHLRDQATVEIYFSTGNDSMV